MLSRFGDGFLEENDDVPVGLARPHFSEVGNVEDVVADAVFIEVTRDVGLASNATANDDGYWDKAGIGADAADVVDFRDAGRGDGLGAVVGGDFVVELLGFIFRR